MIRFVTTSGLVIVAGCAVAVSFNGLYSLALLCAFPRPLAALVPVLADAGAAVATAAWLGGDVPPAARGYAQKLALTLLGASVAGNATAHALAAAGTRPHWVVVVLVGALAPAVLAAVIHLSALVKAGGGEVATWPAEGVADRDEADVEDAHDEPEESPLAASGDDSTSDRQGTTSDRDSEEPDPLAQARELAAAGAGRPALMALGLTDYQARQVIRQVRQEVAG